MPHNKVPRYKTAIIITFLCLFTLLGVDAGDAATYPTNYNAVYPIHSKFPVLRHYCRDTYLGRFARDDGTPYEYKVTYDREYQQTQSPSAYQTAYLTRERYMQRDCTWTPWGPWISVSRSSASSVCYEIAMSQSAPYPQHPYWLTNRNVKGKVVVNIDPAIPGGSMPGIFRIYSNSFYSNNFNDYLLNGETPMPKLSKCLSVDTDDWGIKRYKMCLYYDLGRLYSGNDLEVEATIPDFFTQEASKTAYNYGGFEWDMITQYKYRGFETGDIQLTIGVEGAHPVKATTFYPSLAQLAGVLPELEEKENDYKTIKIQYDIRGFEDALEIYELTAKTNYGGQGKIIRTVSTADLVPTVISEGPLWDSHEWEWDGKDDNGNIVPKGIYPVKVYLKGEDGIVGRTGRVIIDGEVIYDPNQKLYAYLRYGKPTISGNTATFEAYASYGKLDPLLKAKAAKVYLNLYDDNFRFIKRPLSGEEVSFYSEPVDWEFSAYAPGMYHYTVYAEDDNGIQSHVRGGNFEIPEHEIEGETEPFPVSDPDMGWKNEGAIVRVASLLDLVVDSNNNGIVDTGHDEYIEEIEPGFILWINDDNDHWDVSNKYWSEDRTTVRGSSGEPDNTNETINGIHDLEDFFSMKLQIPVDLIEGEKFYLEGAPVRVFKRYFLNPDEDILANTNEESQNAHLTNLEIAKEQHQVDSLGTVGLDTDSRLEMKREDFTEDGFLWLIFEGLSEEGTYDLRFYREVDGVRIDEDTAKITIKDVRDMYKFWNLRVNRVENAQGFDIYNPGAIMMPSGEYYPQDPDKMLVYFHGYNVDVNGARHWFDTTYKRLYRAGYRGGFSGITWEGDEGTALHFNTNWINAFRVAELAKNIIIRVENEWGKGQVNLGAHSLGNMVVLAAVRKMAYEGTSNIVSKIIHLEAAVPANVYNEMVAEDYFDGSFWPNFDVCPIVVNSWSETDDVLPWFNIGMMVFGWTTPDYKDGPVFSPPPFFNERSIQGAMGLRPAAGDFPSGFYTDFSDWKVSRDSDAEEAYEGHPYQIRHHSSMKDEYYLDVEEFFRGFLNRIK
ncbi:MAG: alpha/beta hydrolase [Candidatus Aureabacteria bacterium]|nr:alpha/beta hydrolase [Candidatus Auribacterota bacterium]